MKYLVFLTFICCSTLFAQVPKDPYLTGVSEYTHTIKVRLLYHGTRQFQSMVRAQIEAAEIIYSQCETKPKIIIDSEEFYGESTAQENITVVDDGTVTFTNESLKFMLFHYPSKKKDVMDIHVVNHLNKKIRITNSTRNQELELGVSFNPIIVDWIYKDPRSLKKPTVSELFGSSLFIAMGTLDLIQEKNENFTIYRSRNQKLINRSLSLLAHEMGHILLETQTRENTNDRYTDHYCPLISDYCTKENLMSGGGSNDRIWRDLVTDAVIGYDPLSKIDVKQCEALASHPLIQRGLPK